MNKGKKNKKENDTFARFPSLRNANLLEFNFKVRETKQNKKRKCTREEEQKNNTVLHSHSDSVSDRHYVQ